MFDQPPLQVELQCTIYEIDTTDHAILGADWDAWKRHFAGSLTYFSDSPTGFFDKKFNSYQALLTLDDNFLIEFLNYTVERGHAKIVTATKLTMVNSEDHPGALSGGNRGSATAEPAVIESIVTIPYSVLQSDIGPTNSTNARNEVTEDESFGGVRVEILPFSGTESITLKINAQVNSIVGYTKDNRIPIISTRRINSVVSLKDGKPIVLGALDKLTVTKSRSGIPGLGRIPLLRYLFANETRDNPRVS